MIVTCNFKMINQSHASEMHIKIIYLRIDVNLSHYQFNLKETLSKILDLFQLASDLWVLCFISSKEQWGMCIYKQNISHPIHAGRKYLMN